MKKMMSLSVPRDLALTLVFLGVYGFMYLPVITLKLLKSNILIVGTGKQIYLWNLGWGGTFLCIEESQLGCSLKGDKWKII